MPKAFVINSNLDKAVQHAIRDIGKYDKHTQIKLRKAIREGTENTMRSAKSKVHSVTGNLVRQIVMSYDRNRNLGKVTSKAPYSHFLEQGVSATVVLPKKKKAMKANGFFFKMAYIAQRKPKPFMKPAVDENIPKITREIEEALKP